MIVEFNYTNAEKQKISNWKAGLPPNSMRKFTYGFKEQEKPDEDGNKLYKCLIKSSDSHVLKVTENVCL